MRDAPDIIVFSDLDGTLLDHNSYSWAAAAPVLARLQNLGVGLVLASSKTAAEVAPLRDEMGFADWPAIVENGGGLLPPGQGIPQTDTQYAEIRARLGGLPSGFRGFGDMSEEEIARLTGLPHAGAALAQQRLFSEPGLWTGTEEGLHRFLDRAQAAGLHVRSGGRFLTLSLGGSKADRMAEIIAAFRPRHTMALGDAPNDLEMLQSAEIGVIVKNRQSPPLPRLPGEDTGQIRRSTLEGPQGWAQAVVARLTELGLIEGMKHDG